MRKMIFARLECRLPATLAALAALAQCAALHAATVIVETTCADGAVTTEEVELEVRDSRAVFRWPRAKVPANVKRIAVWPDFAEARQGEDGCWVFPNNRMGRFTRMEGRAYESWGMFMPCFGMATPRGAFCAIATGMPYSLSAEVTVQDGVYRMRALFDKYMDDLYEDISVEFRLLAGADADYSGIARAYRAYQLERGACRPISERVKDQPLLDYAVRHPEVRVRMAWKPVPSPVLEQVTRNEPPVKPVVTFDRMAHFADVCREVGVDGAEFCLVGWNVGGHDGRYPQIFPVEPTLGGRLYTMCPQRAYERFCPKQCAEMATLGFKGLFYLDVVTARPIFPCPDPRHRLNNGQRATWECNILDEVRAVFGGSASEGAHDFCVGSLDSALTIQWCKPFDPPKCKLDDAYVPFWQLVYHGIVLSTPFRTMINCTANPDRRSLLKLAEFGGRPTYYVHSVFVTGRAPSMGTIDLELTTEEKLRQSALWIKEGCDDYNRRRALQFHFMDRHEDLGDGLFRVTYSDGSRLVGNYNDAPRTVDGVQVPALGYLVLGGSASAPRR